MNNVVNPNPETVDEVPLDLFDQVSLDDYKPVDSVEKIEPTNPSTDVKPGRLISIPANSYGAIMEKRKQAANNEPKLENKPTSNADVFEIIDIQ